MQTGEFCRLPKTPKSEFHLVLKSQADEQPLDPSPSTTLTSTSTRLAKWPKMDRSTLLTAWDLSGIQSRMSCKRGVHVERDLYTQKQKEASCREFSVYSHFILYFQHSYNSILSRLRCICAHDARVLQGGKRGA